MLIPKIYMLMIFHLSPSQITTDFVLSTTKIISSWHNAAFTFRNAMIIDHRIKWTMVRLGTYIITDTYNIVPIMT